MNRKDRRALLHEQHAQIAELPERLTPVPESEWPETTPRPILVYRSRKYMVQVYAQKSLDYPELVRLSICRVKLGANGRWEDGLSWEELQAIKREIGFGDWYGVEVYPADEEVINVANFRHLWLLPEPLPIGWFRQVSDGD